MSWFKYLPLTICASCMAQPDLDLAMPQSPALSILGPAPSVVRPATPREFAVSLLSGSQTAIAMDVVPYWLAAGHLIDREIYRTNPIVRLLAGTELSIASIKTSQPSDPPQLAVGILIRIFDIGDPRLDDTLALCVQKAAERVLAGSAPCREGDGCEAESTRREAVFKNTCRGEARARNWNRSSWAVGGAKDTQSNAAIAWSSVAYGFEGIPGLENTSQFIMQFTRRSRDSAGGLRLRTGGPDTHLSIDWTAAAGQSQLSLVGEKKVSENLWLELTVGGAGSRRAFVLTSFHWGLASE